jgi:probable HAF family extracellular repeat protein
MMDRCIALSILAIGAWQSVSAANVYRVADLGTFLGSNLIATDINGLGYVSGYAGTHAVVYRNGIVQDLGTLGGRSSRANGMNNMGQIVGYADTAQGERRAFVYDTKGMHELGTLGGGFSLAYAINDEGVIVGSSPTPVGDVRAVRYEESGPVDLGTLGGSYSQARAINSAGQVTGQSDNESAERHAFLYSGNVMGDLGTLGGISSFGYGINDAGKVVGQSTEARGQQRAFIYDGAEMRELKGLVPDAYGIAIDINNADVVVGMSSGGASQFTFSAVLFDPVLGTIDLNNLINPNSGWHLSEAIGINESGQIIGRGFFESREGSSSFLLTPVPLPGTLLLLACGLIGVLSITARAPGVNLHPNMVCHRLH